MSKLKHLAAVGVSALMLAGAVAAPAAAQPWRHHDHHPYAGRLTTSYVDSLEFKIKNAARYGVISHGEARALMQEFRSVQTLAWRVETGAASSWERRRLASVVDRIEAAVDRPRYRAYGRYDDRW